MPEIFRMRLDEIQPSQLYLNRAKLAHVDVMWHPRTLDMLPPIPVKWLDGRIIFTDGHHRAFAAYRCGFDVVPVFWDEDELDWEAYRICVAWCLTVSIATIRDLGRHIVSPEDYVTCWLDRCKAMQDALAQRPVATGSQGQVL